MDFITNKLYLEDIKKIAEMDFPWEKLSNKKFLITGASGMIGSFLTDVLLYKNRVHSQGIKIIAIGRNEDRLKNRFSYSNDKNLLFCKQDITQPFEQNFGHVEYMLHAASNTHPLAYANDPIGTITTNILGLYNLLEYASEHNLERFLFASSVEIYGENRGDTNLFKEDYCGYIDCNTMRAGYPESKRLCESMCQAYIKQNDLDIVIARLPRTYGPTMLNSDTKAISQFIKKAVNKEDIVLKSEGTQLFSYAYVADSVYGLLTAMFNGKTGAAYNIADESSDITLRNLAQTLADYAGTRIVLDLPDETEKSGYSKATKAIMDPTMIKKLSWSPIYTMEKGLKRTVDILGS